MPHAVYTRTHPLEPWWCARICEDPHEAEVFAWAAITEAMTLGYVLAEAFVWKCCSAGFAAEYLPNVPLAMLAKHLIGSVLFYVTGGP